MDQFSHGKPEDVRLGGISESGSMVSNLPLLFTEGYPTCLDKMTVDQLERFIPFMVECSSGTPRVSEIRTAPKWWPRHLMFGFPLCRPPGDESQWLTVLRDLVVSCYTYHSCEFVLQISTVLSQCPRQNLSFSTSVNGSTHLYNKTSGALLVIFESRNLIYDRVIGSPRREVLRKSNENVEESLTLPPPEKVQGEVVEIYLCDYCEEEFRTLQEVQDHEQIFHEKLQPESSRGRAPTEIVNSEQENFLNYFLLDNSQQQTKQNDPENSDPPSHKRFLGNRSRYRGIELTSPLGVLVHKKPHASKISVGTSLNRVERYCSTTPPETRMRIREQQISKWPVSWKPCEREEDEEEDEEAEAVAEKEKEDWVHVYQPPKRQWRRRSPCMQDGQSLKAMDLIKKCQHVKVQIRRLTEEEIKFYTSKHAPEKLNNLTPPPSKISKSHDQATYGGEETSAKMPPKENYVQPSLKTAPEIMDSVCFNSETEENVGPFPYERQLLPNSLYYDESASDIARTNFRNVSCSNLPIPVVDLVSSDEEQEVVSQNWIQEQLSPLHPNCGDFESDFQELIDYISSSRDDLDKDLDDSLHVNLAHNNSPKLNSEKTYTRAVSDKSVQCTNEDFDSTALHDKLVKPRNNKCECCNAKEETNSQTNLPKLFKSGREL